MDFVMFQDECASQHPVHDQDRHRYQVTHSLDRQGISKKTGKDRPCDGATFIALRQFTIMFLRHDDNKAELPGGRLLPLR